jgi:SagB-type dehydrogenase family enzyme
VTDDALDTIADYHRISKHSLQAFAPGPGHLDWATQPDPFRRYAGADLIHLAHLSHDSGPAYDATFSTGMVLTAPLDHSSISQLFLDSLALSAWKEYRGARWALRVNPSSGNLHPTEGYLICGPVPGLCDSAMVAHYAPREHALEVRAALPGDLWRQLAAHLPEHSLLIGLTSIHWREAWKYGERAYRYCQHDVGHALAAISFAAAGLGWKARLLDEPGTEELSALMGVFAPVDAEPEHPDCLVAVFPETDVIAEPALDPVPVEMLHALLWEGRPNRLSPAQVDWRWVEAASTSATKPRTPVRTGDSQIARFLRDEPAQPLRDPQSSSYAAKSAPGLREVIHRRRSAVEMDGETSIPREAFYGMLRRLRPQVGPFGLLPWEPCVHLGLFVHRVHDLASGLYALLRNPADLDRLRRAMRPDAIWETPPGCSQELPLYLLRKGDARAVARQLSCGQDIAADGCFSAAMLAEFEEPLQRYGAWFYPRLYWECGMIGQVLYLEAEAAGIRGTGIGCFFDDAVHALLGLQDEAFQSLYHFTAGGPEEDSRLMTLPPYPASGA